MVYRLVERAIRVSRRFVTSGQFSSSPTPIIRRYFDGRPAFFVQVGANDGLLGDPLCDLIKTNPLWRGIFIEPVGYALERLMQNYGKSSRFVFEQVAIADAPGEREFYFVSEEAAEDPEVPPLSDKLGSFDRTHIVKHSQRLEKYILARKVRCETIASLLLKHGMKTVDIIHIDVEGYDLHVLRQIDFEEYRPSVVLFEHAHLSSDEYEESRRLLKGHGYRLVNCGLDTIALKVQSSSR
jgi:FkbM family methyltransferase